MYTNSPTVSPFPFSKHMKVTTVPTQFYLNITPPSDPKNEESNKKWNTRIKQKPRDHHFYCVAARLHQTRGVGHSCFQQSCFLRFNVYFSFTVPENRLNFKMYSYSLSSWKRNRPNSVITVTPYNLQTKTNLAACPSAGLPASALGLRHLQMKKINHAKFEISQSKPIWLIPG